MADEWETVELERLVDPTRGISYGIVQPGTPVQDGIPILRVSDIRDGRITTADPLRVSPGIEAAYTRTRLKGGELLLTLVGTVGEAAVVPASLAGWNTARAVAVIPVRQEVGAYWVMLALRAPAVRQIIDSRLNTTVQATLNLRDVAQLPITLPPKREREAIAHILGTLDDKIELNRRMNETLEAMAWALFKSWFVDFDPVRAKAEGRDPGLPKNLADLFPDRFEDSELGEIPAGWTVRGLDEIARFLNGLALQKYPPKNDSSLPVIKIAQLRAGNTNGADLAGANLEADYIVEDGDVLFSWSGSLECILWAGGRGALNQHLFKVTSIEYPKWFYYLWIRRYLADFRHIAAAKATTMGHIQRHHLSEAKVVVPSAVLLQAINRCFDPLIKAIPQRLVQSRSLTAVRDVLLPKLISGDIRIADAGRILGEIS
ncbi:MAG: restriction endonuclease subunit S [Candidatus Manganitrophus sp.]|nr:restriction endonuclease subunit S [Candidatus Manganitrophus sp.]